MLDLRGVKAGGGEVESLAELLFAAPLSPRVGHPNPKNKEKRERKSAFFACACLSVHCETLAAVVNCACVCVGRFFRAGWGNFFFFLRFFFHFGELR